MALAPLTLTQKVQDPSAVRSEFILPPSSVPLNLLLAWPLEQSHSKWRRILAGSVLLHIIFFFAAIRLPSFMTIEQPVHRVAMRRIPLYLPPDVLTQRAPNQQKLSKSIDLADLHSTPTQQPREAAPAPSRKRFEMPQRAVPQQAAKAAPHILAQAPLPDAPKVALNQAPGPLPPGVSTGLPAAATAPSTQSPFQNVGSEAPLNPHPTLAPPKATVQSAIDALAQKARSPQAALSDDNNSQPTPRMPGAIGQPAVPHAAVELQSDPQGADFKPYLTRVLAIVRANWRRVVPESARMGTLRGRTVMEFIINRDGSIPKIVTADSSGSDPLDRAALAGLSMSNPLPPLPADYKGFQVRLAFTFTYNLPSSQ